MQLLENDRQKWKTMFNVSEWFNNILTGIQI